METMATLWRLLRRDTALALVASATLALAIGAVVSTFAVVDGVLLRALPIEEADRVVSVVQTRRDRGGHYAVPYHSYLGWRDRSESFSDLASAIEREFRFAEVGTQAPERIWGTEVSPEYWDALGVRPALGRALVEADAQPGADPAVVISDVFWRSRLSGDPEVLGRELRLDDTPYTIVGIMPPAREEGFLEWRTFWVPLAIDEAAVRAQVLAEGREASALWGYSVIGRLAPGVTLDSARTDLDQVARWLEEEYPRFNQGWTAEMHPIRWWIDGHVRSQLFMVLLGVVLVLLIACANVGNLMLSQASTRGRELAVRQALGAGRARLIRQLLTEAVSLSLIGGLGGLVLAIVATAALRSAAGSRLPRVEEIAVDPRVAVFCLGVSLVAGLLSGVIPALRLSRGASLSLAAGGRSMTDAVGTRRWRSTLVAAQVGLALTVGVGAMLLGRSVQELQQVDPGWSSEEVLTVRLELPEESLPEKEARIESFRELTRRVGALPGVEQAAMCGTRLPLLSGQGAFELFVEGQPRSDTAEIVVTAGYVSPGYFETMGIALVEGQGFAADATWENTQAVVVSESFAREYFPREAFPGGAVGRYVEWASGDRGTIVGVACDVHQTGLDRDPSKLVYLAWGTAPHSQILVVRSDRALSSLVQPVRAAIGSWTAGTFVSDVSTGREIVRESYANRRFSTSLFGAFGALALLLGALGVYAVVAHSTGLRRREMAIRLACGARGEQVVALVMRESLRPVWVGLVFGSAGAIGLGRLLESQLFGVSSQDPASFAGAGLLLVVAAAAASLAPARLAARVDPATSLRAE